MRASKSPQILVKPHGGSTFLGAAASPLFGGGLRCGNFRGFFRSFAAAIADLGFSGASAPRLIECRISGAKIQDTAAGVLENCEIIANGITITDEAILGPTRNNAVQEEESHL